MTSKSDVGAYSYPASGSARPNAVSAIMGALTTTFTYDAKGNMTSGNGLSMSYTAYNKPSSITRGTTTITFDHDPEHQRFRQTSATGTTLYLGGAEKVVGSSGTVTWNNFLVTSGGLVGVFIQMPDATTKTRYFHKDHLGSVAVITNETGAVVERLSFDAWGKRRQPNGADDPSGSVTSSTTKGFTGHEELDSVGLVHMNGRVYDPIIGRFGQADPVTESPFSTQGWNRYSYVGNSPTNFTDPSGYCFMGCFWKPLMKGLGNFLRNNPIVGQIFQIVATMACLGNPVCGMAVAAATSFVITGLTSGNLGQALRAGFISLVTAIAFNAVGNATAMADGSHALPFGSSNHLANIAGHAAVGCASAVASGGKCGPGALSGAAGSFASPLLAGANLGLVGNTAAHALVGGLASVAGGGKFGNGAVTAAFGYLYNACGGPNGCAAALGIAGTAMGVVAAAGCDAGTVGACAIAKPGIVAGFDAAGAAAGMWMDNWLDTGAAANDNARVHANSAASMMGTDVYHLMNRTTGEIDKIGITSYPESRYSQSYLDAQNVNYVTIQQYSSRYPAMVHENISLTSYLVTNGRLPRLNMVTR